MGRAPRAGPDPAPRPCGRSRRGAPLAKPIVAAAGGRARVRGPGSALTRGFFARLGLASPSAAARLAGFLGRRLGRHFFSLGFPSVFTSVFTVTVLLRLGGMVGPFAPSLRARCFQTSVLHDQLLPFRAPIAAQGAVIQITAAWMLLSYVGCECASRCADRTIDLPTAPKTRAVGQRQKCST